MKTTLVKRAEGDWAVVIRGDNSDWPHLSKVADILKRMGSQVAVKSAPSASYLEFPIDMPEEMPE